MFIFVVVLNVVLSCCTLLFILISYYYCSLPSFIGFVYIYCCLLLLLLLVIIVRIVRLYSSSLCSVSLLVAMVIIAIFFTFIASHKSNFVCYLIVIISFHWHCLLMLFLLHTFVTHAIIVFLLTILVSFIVD